MFRTTALAFFAIFQIITLSLGLSVNESTSTTFQVCNQSPKRVNLTSQPPNVHIATQLPAYYNDKNYVEILQGTKFPRNIRASSNGFVQTVIEAYNGHHNLIIRPDDIWIAILFQFSLYVNANAEEFRGQFVNFTGKKELNVHLNGSNIYDVPYDSFVSVMIDKIHENLIDEKIRNWVIPDFTTTRNDDVITSGVILMATLKHYFVYRGTIMCGIPSITLEGSIEDWKKVEQRLTRFDQYNLSKWSKMLKPIISQFIQTKSGNVDVNFWENIFYYEDINMICGHVNGMSGWITAFAVFGKDGKWQGGQGQGGRIWPQIESQHIPPGVVEADVIIDDNGKEFMAKMFAGHMASEVLKDGYTLQPRSGWAIALKDENKNGDLIAEDQKHSAEESTESEMFDYEKLDSTPNLGTVVGAGKIRKEGDYDYETLNYQNIRDSKETRKITKTETGLNFTIEKVRTRELKMSGETEEDSKNPRIEKIIEHETENEKVSATSSPSKSNGVEHKFPATFILPIISLSSFVLHEAFLFR